MTASPSILVFSDLDGTLLDHETYAWEAAVPALDRLRRVKAGLVLASSKTAAEMAPLRAAIGFPDWPAIVENGGGVLEAGQDQVADASAYHRIREALHTLPAGFLGFGDMSAEDISTRTGLDADSAVRAKDRQFSEPGIWTHSDESFAQFLEAARQAGLTVQRGGRFSTLSFGCTKAQQMSALITRYAPRHTLALGDAPNDIEMLLGADIGVIVANPAGAGIAPLPEEGTGRIRRSTRAGPEGWAEAVQGLLDELTFAGEPTDHG